MCPASDNNNPHIKCNIYLCVCAYITFSFVITIQRITEKEELSNEKCHGNTKYIGHQPEWVNIQLLEQQNVLIKERWD